MRLARMAVIAILSIALISVIACSQPTPEPTLTPTPTSAPAGAFLKIHEISSNVQDQSDPSETQQPCGEHVGNQGCFKWDLTFSMVNTGDSTASAITVTLNYFDTSGYHRWRTGPYIGDLLPGQSTQFDMQVDCICDEYYQDGFSYTAAYSQDGVQKWEVDVVEY